MNGSTGKWAYTKGLHDLGNGCYAYLQPDGGWGWSNAGLIVDGEESLLVDTLFDLKLTGEMLETMKAAEPRAAAQIGTVVNTHHNGDHCNGNCLCTGAEIIAHEACVEGMKAEPPSLLAGFLKMAPELGELGEFIQHCFGAFEFEGIEQRFADITFTDRLTRKVGDKTIELVHVGPAHTKGDILAYVPADRTVYTGDILFIHGHPIMWEGPVGNWIRACERIMEMDVETIVPGHGPITDKNGVNEVKTYLEYIRDEARKRYDTGMDAFEAAQDIDLTDYSSWGDGERIAVNVNTLYREFSGEEGEADAATMFGQMAALANRK